MRKLALLLLVTGCGPAGSASAPPPAASSTDTKAPLAARPPSTALPSAAPDAPAAAPWKAPPIVPPLAAAGPRVYVADARGLIEVAAPGGSQVVIPGDVAWCNADARGQVVWYVMNSSLYAYDLVDRKAHAVLVHPGGDVGPIDVSSPPIIAWAGQQLGGERKVDYSIAPLLTMTSPPKLGASVGCDGDRAHYCYQSPIDLDHPKLNDDLAQRKATFEASSFAEPAYVAEVAARGAKGSLWTPLPAPPKAPKKPPTVDPSACDALPEVCGKMRAIPMSSLWVVLVGNSRGDFYHQSDALWDETTGEYIAVSDGQLKRSKAPGEGGELGEMRVSPGGVLSHAGVVFDGKVIHFAPKGDKGLTCGWSTGGYRTADIADTAAATRPRKK